MKTTKSTDVWAELIRAGVRQYKCATTREAAVMLATLEKEAVRGADLLVSYPHVGPALTRLADLADRYSATRVRLLFGFPGPLT